MGGFFLRVAFCVLSSFLLFFVQRDFGPLLRLANARKGVILGVVVPLAILLRHPAIVMGALRVGGVAALYVTQILLKNPELKRILTR